MPQRDPMGYLLLDLHQLTPENMRVRTNCLRKTYLNNGFSSRRFICNMSKHMKDNLPYLQVLVKSKPKLHKLLEHGPVIIEHGPVSLITSICECALNLLKGVIPLTPRQKHRLAWYKTHLRGLASKKVSRKRKKQFLNQKGGNLLTALLPPVLTVLVSLLTK